MNYSVHELAEIADISVRTLHHYDEIGLLNPERKANGYRAYGEADLLMLQQILFFKELDFPLERIRTILNDPTFDMSAALQEHKQLLNLKKKRLNALLGTIDQTLTSLSHSTPMDDNTLYEGFSTDEIDTYAKEAEQRWGHTDAYKQSTERTQHFTKEDYNRIQKETDMLTKKIAACIPSGATSVKTQAAIAEHYKSIAQFYDPTPEIYRGLGNMYVEDARFRAFYEKYDPALPEFMRDAIYRYCYQLESGS